MRLVSRSRLTSGQSSHISLRRCACVQIDSAFKPEQSIQVHCHQVGGVCRSHTVEHTSNQHKINTTSTSVSIMNWRQHRMRRNRNFNCFAFSNLYFIYMETRLLVLHTHAQAHTIPASCALRNGTFWQTKQFGKFNGQITKCWWMIVLC